MRSAAPVVLQRVKPRSLRPLGLGMIAVAAGLVLFAVAFSERLGPVALILVVIAMVNAVRGGLWFVRRDRGP